MYSKRHHMTERQALEELGTVLDQRSAEIAKVQEEYSAKWPPEKRRQALQSGDALPGDPPKFPIKDQEDMNNPNLAPTRRLLSPCSWPFSNRPGPMEKSTFIMKRSTFSRESDRLQSRPCRC